MGPGDNGLMNPWALGTAPWELHVDPWDPESLYGGFAVLLFPCVVLLSLGN